jgi:Family of unknown function (DUF6152)
MRFQPRFTSIAVRSLMAAALFFALSSTSSAHHGWGGYETKEFEISGAVDTPLRLSGPHATMKIKVDGQVWALTLAPPNQTVKSGLRDAKIPIGATVTAHGHRSVDPKNFEIKTERITYNGKTYNVYPDRT